MSLKLNFIGDLMLGGEFSQNYQSYRDTCVPSELYEWLGKDPVFSNLEAAASNRGDRASSKISVYTKKEPLALLSKLNVKCVSLANNHIMDFGYMAAKDTTDVLDNLGITYSGCGVNLSDALMPGILDHEGHSIVFHAFSWTARFYEKVQEATATEPGVAPIDFDIINEAVSRSKEKYPAAIQIVSLHWGEGMVQYPRPDQVEFARSLSGIGVDIVFGHHPHCIQGVEVFKNMPIIYSAGNFIASAYNRTPDKMMTYGDGWQRQRFNRERRVAIFKLVRSDLGKWSIRTRYYKQHSNKPILEIPTVYERLSIGFSQRLSSFLLKNPVYKVLFPFIRRVNEITRLVDEIHTRNGLWSSLFKFKSYGLVIKRILKSEEYH
jgi:poly-gamma-glutamate capsule biosynthesis protein CapA/YwtB (metallophosphatase superfamily)